MDLNVYQHFRQDEHSYIAEVEQWLTKVEQQYTPFLTEFLDPRQVYILETFVNQRPDINMQIAGGYARAERQRCLIYPDYYEPTRTDFEIVPLEINYPQKFIQLQHGQILGTLANSGMKRELFGDIITDGQRWQIFVAENIVNYLTMQVEQIARTKVFFTPCASTALIEPNTRWQTEQTTVSSLRLDVVVANSFHLSRQQVKQLLEQKKVKLNWTETTQGTQLVATHDLLSVRGFGRIHVQEIIGTTKKEKIRLAVGILRK